MNENEWVSMEYERPNLGCLYDIKLDDGSIIECVEASEVNDGFLIDVVFLQYRNATHFRKHK